MAEICREFGVSRKTAHKWLCRYEVDGPTGLAVAHGCRLSTRRTIVQVGR